MSDGPGIAPLAAAFRAHRDDPVRALARCTEAAKRGAKDKALLVLAPGARMEAEASAQRLKDGTARSDLEGIPLAIKDCIDVAGLPSTNGTAFLTQPAAKDAACVTRLREAGAVIFAKANMHEFGIQPTGVNPHHGTPRNPWDKKRIPGGSSSGSAVAVATGIVPAALGTDAGGSVRVPAAVNGLIGLKPTYGAIPDEGVAKLTKDLDHVGALAWTVDDAALLFEVLSGRSAAHWQELGRVGLLTDFFENAQERVATAVRAAAAETFGPIPQLASPLCAWAAAVEFVMVGTDAPALMGDLMVRHAAQMGADARVILQLGAGLSWEDRRRADGVRAGMRRELEALLEKVDLLVAPSIGGDAPLLRRAARRTGELDTRAIAQLAAVTFPANLTGLPSCTVPCTREGLPLGLQLIGRAGDEGRVLAAARAVELRFGARRPPRWHGG